MKITKLTKITISILFGLSLIITGGITSNASSNPSTPNQPQVNKKVATPKPNWQQAIVTSNTTIYKMHPGALNQHNVKGTLNLKPGRVVYMDINNPKDGKAPLAISTKTPKHNKAYVNKKTHWVTFDYTHFKVMNSNYDQ